MNNIPTPHNECKDENLIAKTVLMPGDPLRAKYIADNFLEDVKMFTSVRNIYGYTGKYNGKLISVMASGMGMPSIGIYSYELFKFYGVEEIIRIGSAGSYSKDLDVLDVVIASSSYSDSSFAKVYANDDAKVKYPSKELNERLEASANKLGIKFKKGKIYSSDCFYSVSDEHMKDVYKEDCIAVEMESFALFTIAESLNKKAACVLTISDSFVKPEKLSSKERENSLIDMIKIALNA